MSATIEAKRNAALEQNRTDSRGAAAQPAAQPLAKAALLGRNPLAQPSRVSLNVGNGKPSSIGLPGLNNPWSQAGANPLQVAARAAQIQAQAQQMAAQAAAVQAQAQFVAAQAAQVQAQALSQAAGQNVAQPEQQQQPQQAQQPVADYASTFGQQSYVKNGQDPQLVGLMTQAAQKFPELANGPLGEALKSGNVGPDQVKAVQQYLESKGYKCGPQGADGKYGPNTHAALSAALEGKAPAEATNPTQPGANPPTQANPNANAQVGDPNSWFISQYPSKSNPNENTANNGNCGPTSLLMVAKAFGATNPSPAEVNKAIEDIRRRGGATMEERVGHGSGTSIPQLAKAAQSFGLKTQSMTGNPNDVAAQLAQGKLVVALVKPAGYSNSRSTGHYVVVTKIENGKVYLNDPAKRDGPRVVSLDGFRRAMSMKGGQFLAVGS